MYLVLSECSASLLALNQSAMFLSSNNLVNERWDMKILVSSAKGMNFKQGEVTKVE